jgi:photosystem II stability/assembly factor-like uncharacterized protein
VRVGRFFARRTEVRLGTSSASVPSLHGVAVGSNGTILRTEDGGETWKRVDRNVKEWLYAVAFADTQRGYAVGARGIILRTDDGGATWKDLETGLTTNLFAIGLAGPDDVIVTGDQGRILNSKDAGQSWQIQPSITSSPLFAVAYRGGTNLWVAGRGGAILKRVEPIATVKIPTPRLPPMMRGTPKAQSLNQEAPVLDDGDIPRAVPPVKKPVRP